MNDKELKKALKAGEAEPVAPEQPALPEQNKQDEEATSEPQTFNFDIRDFIIILRAAQKMKQHLTAAPTYKPKHFLEQIAFVDDGAGNQSAYFYINNTWRGVDLPLT